MKKRTNLGKNIITSVGVQIVSLLVSFILGFIVPKYIDGYQYASWQTYVLYVGYVGILHFGLLDGIILRYSQFDYEELDKRRIRSQFKILLFSISVISFLVSVIAIFFFSDIAFITVFFVAIGIISKNLITYNSYSFQLTNRIDKYAILIISQRMSYGLLVIFLLLKRVNNFMWYCGADLTGDLIGLIIARHFNQGMYFGPSLPFGEAFQEWKTNVSAGVILMLANWSSMLLIGGAKMVVQWRWDQLIFGKVSFAFSLSNLFLTFVTAVSVALFPQMKRMEKQKLPMLYQNIRGIISPTLFVVMLFYFPGCWILERYLPAYQASLAYLGILLPIVVYTSKVSLLTNNYLKAYRKEKSMLWINGFFVLFAFVLYSTGAYLFNSLDFVLISVVVATMLRSISSEIVIMQTIRLNFVKNFFAEAIMTLIFISCVNVLSRWVACGVYAIALAGYLAIYRKTLLSFLFQKGIWRGA